MASLRSAICLLVVGDCTQGGREGGRSDPSQAWLTTPTTARAPAGALTPSSTTCSAQDQHCERTSQAKNQLTKLPNLRRRARRGVSIWLGRSAARKPIAWDPPPSPSPPCVCSTYSQRDNQSLKSAALAVAFYYKFPTFDSEREQRCCQQREASSAVDQRCAHRLLTESRTMSQPLAPLPCNWEHPGPPESS